MRGSVNALASLDAVDVAASTRVADARTMPDDVSKEAVAAIADRSRLNWLPLHQTHSRSRTVSCAG